MSDSSSEAHQLVLPLVEPGPDSLRHSGERHSEERYSEEDDVATQFVETPRPDPAWLVQVTLFDRRWMSKDELLWELQHARLVRAETPVWQLGMRDWRAVARVEELSAALPPPERQRPARPAVAANGRGLAGAALLLAVLAMALAFAALLQR